MVPVEVEQQLAEVQQRTVAKVAEGQELKAAAVVAVAEDRTSHVVIVAKAVRAHMRWLEAGQTGKRILEEEAQCLVVLA